MDGFSLARRASAEFVGTASFYVPLGDRCHASGFASAHGSQ
jgi:hypothetical protein